MIKLTFRKLLTIARLSISQGYTQEETRAFLAGLTCGAEMYYTPKGGKK